MSTSSIGNMAEAAVATYLADCGYQIINRNWRTRWCEIDIIAKKANTIYFIEIRYRSRSEWGTGIDTITPKKLSQMTFAANYWLASHPWNGDCQLLAISTTGKPVTIDSMIEL